MGVIDECGKGQHKTCGGPECTCACHMTRMRPKQWKEYQARILEAENEGVA